MEERNLILEGYDKRKCWFYVWGIIFVVELFCIGWFIILFYFANFNDNVINEFLYL